MSYQQFDRLKPVAVAAYDCGRRNSCFGDTRALLLSEIQEWVNNSGGRPIYVLYGIAGIGKSTVAKTVAERADGETLGASFFFSRDEDNRKTLKSFFTTIAYQLSCHYPKIAEQTNITLEEAPEVVERDPVHQFDCLVAKPLRTVIGETPILVVIDALDECEEEDAEVILSLLAQEVPHIPCLRVFITARPEQHIRSVFEQDHNHDQFHLHDIDQSIVEADIRSYLEFRLSVRQVQKTFPGLQSIWQLTGEQMNSLVAVSGKLFIIAATAANFILDHKQVDPAGQLAVLLNGVADTASLGPKPMTMMDKMYMGIIHAAQPDPVGKWIDRFQVCVGTIVLLYDPLPCDVLAALTGIDVDDIVRTLSNLHSLFAPSSNGQPFRVHHKSFPDFICDPDRCGGPQFWINQKAHHLRIAKRCLHIMDRVLKPNPRGIQRSEWHRHQNHILHHTQHGVSPCLAYACTYWAFHLVGALNNEVGFDSEVTELLERFASRHLLTWLEALSMIGRVDIAYSSLDMVCTLEQERHNSNIPTTPTSMQLRSTFLHGANICSPLKGMTRELFNDGCRFIQQCMSVICSLPMEIYNSMLLFMPRDTALYRTYGGLGVCNVDVISGFKTAWSPTIAVLADHSDRIYCVVFSADGSRLASASADRMIRLWDGRTGHHIITLKGHAGPVYSVSFSPVDSRLATASDDGTIRLWGSRTGRHISTLSILAGHCAAIFCVTFSADGSKLASGSGDRSIRLWDGGTGNCIGIICNSGAVHSVAFSRNGLMLASASDNVVQLWDVQTRHHITTLEGHSGEVESVSFSPDSSRLASACGGVWVWDLGPDPLPAIQISHGGAARSVAFSPDGLRLASGSWDGTVQLWDGTSGTSITTLKGHSSVVSSVTFSPDGSRLASASNTVRLWDSRTDHVAGPSVHFDTLYTVAFSPDGSKLASVPASNNKTILLRDGITGIYIATLEGHSGSIGFMIFLADGSRLASASEDGTIRLWDISGAGCCITTFEGHSSWVGSIAIPADGSRLASASGDTTIRLWDSSTGACIGILRGHSGPVRTVIFSPDGQRLASASQDESVWLWDGRTGAHIITLAGHSSWVLSLAFSPDGLWFASASEDHTIRLWDSRTGNHITTLNEHSDWVKSVIFAADGSRLISKSWGKNLLLWDITDITRPRVLFKKTAEFYLDSTHNSLFLLETRTDPTLCGLTVLNLRDEISFDTQIICWFPPDFSPCQLAVHPTASMAAIRCEDGRVLLLDISKVPIS